MSPERTAAFFDVDRTLVVPRSMEQVFIPFLIRRRYLKAGDLARYVGHLCRRLPNLDSGALRDNKYHFKDKDPGELDRLARECFQERIAPLVSAKGRSKVNEHRDAGHMVVLITGTLEPLARRLQDELGAHLALASRLEVESGRLGGHLQNKRPYGAEKARLVRQVAREYGLDLGRCWAYGDHHSDVDILSAVGNPVAVNPDFNLRQVANQRGWPILAF